jgi:beta-glucanase (GH16 family)
MRGAGCKYSTIPPVTSATFRSRRTFKFGRLEIRARLPRGDWLWPAIWMLPQDSVYGGWPASGEIDLMESRGNTGSSSCGPWQDSSGFGSTLHFGPDAAHNAYSHTHTETHVDGSLSDDFHTFGLMWSERGLYTYLDDDKDVVLAVDFAQRSFWDRGQTPETVCWARKNGQCTFWMPLWIGSNWTGTDTWAKKGTRAAPFDQEFFLQVNLAVGGTGGYFPDYCLRKPWRNGDSEPGSDFLADFERWWPTWGGDVEHPEKGAARSSAMAIDWIRYWPDEHHAEPSKLVQF